MACRKPNTTTTGGHRHEQNVNRVSLLRKMSKLQAITVASVLVMFFLLIICATQHSLSANVGLQDISQSLVNEARNQPGKVVKRSLRGGPAWHPPSPFHSQGPHQNLPDCC
ncbi:hypothetical protein RND81_13G134600 [Saponaria officinalis]|uniref:Transmembrane protein n=1 Tax=Saponaria officinalis TaxID=3572 RepID=A0AAW1GXD1_SAPOF